MLITQSDTLSRCHLSMSKSKPDIQQRNCFMNRVTFFSPLQVSMAEARLYYVT